MKRICLQRNTIEDKRKLNTGDRSRYSSVTGEFHQAEILLKEQHFDPKATLPVKHFVRMKPQTKLILIRIAGGLSILFTLFHASFYWIFKWSQTLTVMNPTDKGILLTFNLIGILLLLYSVILSFVYTRQLIETITGKSLLLFFSSFYIIRIFSEFSYFGFHAPDSMIIIVVCLIPAICFGLPALLKTK